MRLYIIIFLICIPCFSFGSFASKIFPEFNLFKADIAKNADSLIKANTEIGRNADALMKLNLRVGNIETNANANANAVVGLRNEIKNINTTVGRDSTNTQTSTNDSKLLQYLFEVLFGFVSMICFNLILTVRQLTKQNNQKDEKMFSYIDRYVGTLLKMVSDELQEDDRTTKGTQEADRILKEVKEEVKTT